MAKGHWLAVANVLVIAVALSVDLGKSVVAPVVMFAIIPALLLGAVLGMVADATATHRPVMRFVVLALPACGLVVLLAYAFSMARWVPHACIPTLVAASLLERMTRVGLADGGPPRARTSRTRCA